MWAQGGNGESDCVESLRESGHGEAVQAEAVAVVNGRGLALSRSRQILKRTAETQVPATLSKLCTAVASPLQYGAEEGVFAWF